MASQPHPILTFEEYLALERETGSKYEYCDGQVFAMSGVSPAHSLLQTRLTNAFGSRLAGGTCDVYSSDLRVVIQASGLYTFPDLSIICGRPTLVRGMAATNPVVIVEVLSPSTRRYDLVGKFAHYRQIPTLAEYVLVEQDCRLIQRHRRLADGEWELTRYEGEDAVLELDSVGIAVPLREIYANVPFELAEREPEQP